MAESESIVILDYEYWSDKDTQKNRRRGLDDLPPLLTQVGAIKLSLTDGLPEVNALDMLVIPRDVLGRRIVLKPFLQTLTNTTNADIMQKGRELDEAMQRLGAFVGDSLVFSYGHDDLACSVITCHIHNVPHPFPHAQARDIRKAMHKAGVPENVLMSVSSGEIGAHLGAPAHDGHHTHDALDDVRSVARALRLLLADGKLDMDWLRATTNRVPWGEDDLLH